jgi:uncharacterized protein
MNEENIYDFVWDPAKALANVQKHGVTFDQAATVLLDALALTVYDEAHSQHEDRWFTLGLETGGKLLAIAHTYEIIGPTKAGSGLSRPGGRRDPSDATTKMNLDR